MSIGQSSFERWSCTLLMAAAALQASAQDSVYPGATKGGVTPDYGSTRPGFGTPAAQVGGSATGLPYPGARVPDHGQAGGSTFPGAGGSSSGPAPGSTDSQAGVAGPGPVGSAYPGIGAQTGDVASDGRSIVETFFLFQAVTDEAAGALGDGTGDADRGRIAQIGGASVQYDGSGRVVRFAGEEVVYDSRGRVVRFGGEMVHHDSAGRPVMVGRARIDRDTAGRITHIGSARIDYDRSGRILRIGGTPVRYDAQGRWSSYGGTQVQYRK